MAIRVARLADAPAIAQVHVTAWRATYRGLLPATLLDNLSVEGRIQEWNEILSLGGGYILVSTYAERIIGFAGCGECRDYDLNDGRTGELYAIYLDPAFWGQGYGIALLNAALTLLQRDDYRLATLWVLEGNQRARRFYARTGFAPDGDIKVEALPGGVEVRELRYRRTLPLLRSPPVANALGDR